MKSVAFGSQEQERVMVTALSYERPASGEFYDDNWLLCEVQVHAGAFHGKFHANFLTSEFADLSIELGRLHRELRGEVSFEPMEEKLVLNFSCDNLGHIHVTGSARDEAGIGHKLSFSMSFDQTYLAKSLEDLGAVLRAFPVRT